MSDEQLTVNAERLARILTRYERTDPDSLSRRMEFDGEFPIDGIREDGNAGTLAWRFRLKAAEGIIKDELSAMIREHQKGEMVEIDVASLTYDPEEWPDNDDDLLICYECKCETCRWWVNVSPDGNVGDCICMPSHVEKEYDDRCGQWKEREWRQFDR